MSARACLAEQRADLCLQSTGILYATREYRHPCVKSHLTLSSSFLILRDLRRNRLADRLTSARAAPTLDKYGINAERDAIAALAPQPFRLCAVVNSCVQNIFNGLLRVPVNEIILALN